MIKAASPGSLKQTLPPMHMSSTSRHWLRRTLRSSALPLAGLAFTALAACQSGGAGSTKEPASGAAGGGLTAGPTKKPPATPPHAAKPVPKTVPAPADVAGPSEKAVKTASGLASLVLQAGTGAAHPEPVDTVKVHYSGWTKDGKMFDSSVTRNKPSEFPLNRVIKGWTEGIPLMVVGEKRRFWIPGALAYGEKPRRPGAPSGQLTFDVELLEIKKFVPPSPPPETPKDVASAPKTAKKTASGLKYVVLREGKGDKLPTPKNRVKVHYSGWTKDGKMFDSSVPRGKPSTFGVTQVIKGWVEGLQLMKVGEKTRFWIPAELAYGEKPAGRGRPAGQLTFDVELLEIL